MFLVQVPFYFIFGQTILQIMSLWTWFPSACMSSMGLNKRSSSGCFSLSKIISANTNTIIKITGDSFNSICIRSCPSVTCERQTREHNKTGLSGAHLYWNSGLLNYWESVLVCVNMMYSPHKEQCTVHFPNMSKSHLWYVTVRPSHIGCWLCIETSSKTGRSRWAETKQKRTY